MKRFLGLCLVAGILSQAGLVAREVVTMEEFGLISLSGGSIVDVSADGMVIVGESDIGIFRLEGNINPKIILGMHRIIDISDDGTVVLGEYEDWNPANSKIEPVIWKDGKTTHLGFPPGGEGDKYCKPSCLSGDGRVAYGHYLKENRASTFKWEDGTYSEAKPGSRATSYDGRIRLGATGDNQSDGFRWEDGTFEYLEKLPGHHTSRPTDISYDGKSIVGNCYRAYDGGSHEPHACIWIDGELSALEEVPDTLFSRALEISGDGSLVIGAYVAFDTWGAILWRREDNYQPVLLTDLVAAHGHDPQYISISFWDQVVLSEDGTTIICPSSSGIRSFFRIQILNLFGPHRIHDNHCDTGDWMGWLNVEFEPWAYCLKTQCWFYIPESVAETGSGWIYIPNLTTDVPELWLVMEGGTSWGYSYGLNKWMYVTGSGWVYLVG